VLINKLRTFQQFGHEVIFLIGDFTGLIGDPTGRSATRPPLTREEVLVNAATYTDQAFKILDKSKTEIVYNGDWFRKMTYEEILRLNSSVTLQQMLQREDFRTRPGWGVSAGLDAPYRTVVRYSRLAPLREVAEGALWYVGFRLVEAVVR
jgi:tyrosyl-tRNA synthetase